ncbi:MAG TPA: TolC family protein [Ignavibacteriaceae bacterium]|nr:TolC family protein [Ignavibacteriaceae bacterium]
MRSTIIILFTILINAIISPQEKLTLDGAIGIALHKNSTFLKSSSQIDGFKSGVQAAYGNFLPTLDANANWQWNKTDQQGLIVDPVTGQIIDASLSDQRRSYTLGLGSNWTLFDGLANIANLSKTQDELQSAEFTLERIKQDIVFQTMSLYYDIVYTEQLLRVKEDNLKWNEKNLETIKERSRLGAATLADVYQQEVAKGNAELELIVTENDLQTQKKNLLFYLGIDVLEEYEFSDSLTAIEIEILNSNLLEDYQDITVLVNQALDQRLDYKSAMLNLQSAKSGVTIAESGHWPSLNANANYYWLGNSLSEVDKNKNLQVGLGLNIPIFYGWSVSNRVQLAEVQSKISEIEVSDIERDIKRQIQTNYLNLQASQKALVVSEKNISAAKENLKIEEEKYALGSGKLLDVLIVNSRYTDALTSLLNSQFAYIVLSQQLKYYLGVLDYKIYEQ